jgi:type IV secretion system protein VirB9
MRIAAAILFASVSLAAIGHPVSAQGSPQAPTQIRVVPYSPLLRTEIIGVIGQPTTITFPPGESVYRVVQTGKPDKNGALADAGWQGASPAEIKDTPLGNNLTLWPVMLGESTMTVITMSSTGAQNVYPFRLVARPDTDGAADAPGVVLNLIFKGGAAVTPGASAGARNVGVVRRRATIRHSVSTVAQMAAEEQLRTDAFNGADGSCHYVAKGRWPTPIQPRCPMDNGQWTLMRFPGLSAKPTVYVVGNDGSERLARQHAAGDFVVVEEIAPHFRLRLSPNVLDILDTAYDPAGKPAGTGTTSPAVQRDILQAKAR